MRLRLLMTASFSALALASLSAVAPAQAGGAGAPFDIWAGTQVGGGLPSDAPADTHCVKSDPADTDVAAGCFKEYGDHIYVKDNKADGRSAMIYYTVNGDDAACVNSGGNGTVAECDLSPWIPENKQVCIWAGNIELESNASDRFHYYIEWGSKVCFMNNS